MLLWLALARERSSYENRARNSWNTVVIFDFGCDRDRLISFELHWELGMKIRLLLMDRCLGGALS
ncbi:hypothetical protein Pse7367_1709 [Thalassoporum mexicanum PCC 7367]|nr:hypothetical protein Pse7367_1709 [Pseudanabaena sp. PCC 7367]